MILVAYSLERGKSMENCVTLKKLGGFYSAYNDDAYVLFYLFHYNVKNKKAGFPLSAYNKVINCLEENYVSYIVEGKEEIKRDFKKKNKYNFFVGKGKKLYEREQRSNFIYERITELKENEVDELLKIIEDYVFQ